MSSLLFLANVCLFIWSFIDSVNSISCNGDCICTADSQCLLTCNGWKVCESGTLTCKSGYGCDVNCDSSGGTKGDACKFATINGNGATYLSITCIEHSDCWEINVDCGTASSCNIDCGSADNNCRDMTLNCRSSDCSITCSGAFQSCTSMNIDISNANSFECIGPTPACSPAPAPKLPPTTQPTDNPSTLPTTGQPTNNPITAQPSTTPTYTPSNPSMIPSDNPSLTPTQTIIIVTNFTLTVDIEYIGGNVTADNIVDVIDNYLNTLFVDEDYNLIVDIVSINGSVVTLKVTVGGDEGDEIDTNQLIADTEDQLTDTYGDIVIINSIASTTHFYTTSYQTTMTADENNNQNSNTDDKVIIVSVCVVLIVVIVIIVVIILYKREKNVNELNKSVEMSNKTEYGAPRVISQSTDGALLPLGNDNKKKSIDIGNVAPVNIVSTNDLDTMEPVDGEEDVEVDNMDHVPDHMDNDGEELYDDGIVTKGATIGHVTAGSDSDNENDKIYEKGNTTKGDNDNTNDMDNDSDHDGNTDKLYDKQSNVTTKG